MTKKDLVLKVSKNTGIKQVTVKKIIEELFSAMMEALKSKERIELRNFGVFYFKKRKAKIGRNPKTKEIVPIPPRQIIVFKPGRKLKSFS
ncbi:MAG: integration host factor subunit beta [Candidatus Omnitrophota bacterium]|nr:MAG: integration host factor subunit beta [Candidatus Omnitrophota bacterium]